MAIIAVFRNLVVYRYRPCFSTNTRSSNFDFLKRSDRRNRRTNRAMLEIDVASIDRGKYSIRATIRETDMEIFVRQPIIRSIIQPIIQLLVRPNVAF